MEHFHSPLLVIPALLSIILFVASAGLWLWKIWVVTFVFLDKTLKTHLASPKTRRLSKMLLFKGKYGKDGLRSDRTTTHLFLTFIAGVIIYWLWEQFSIGCAHIGKGFNCYDLNSLNTGLFALVLFLTGASGVVVLSALQYRQENHRRK